MLVQGTPFDFDEQCVQAFSILKNRLVSTPIVVAPDLDLPFELMCEASDYAIRAVLGEKRERIFQVIHHANQTLNDAQLNNDASVVVKFLRSHIFTWFDTPQSLIKNCGTHLCNELVDKVL